MVTAGPPGAGKSTVLTQAVPDLASRLVIDADVAKEFLAEWCTSRGIYDKLFAVVLPDGGNLRPLELSPLLQTVSTEVTNQVRRTALDRHLDVVVEATMASPRFGERLMLSLAKADYSELLVVSVETDRDTAQTRAVERWWKGRLDNPDTGGRLVLPETIDAAYDRGETTSRCRHNARTLVNTIRAGGTVINSVTLAEYDNGALIHLNAEPPRAVRQSDH